MVERLSYTGSIFVCNPFHTPWPAKVWLLCVSSKAYTRISEVNVLGDEIHTGTIMEVLSSPPPSIEHENGEVFISFYRLPPRIGLAAMRRFSCRGVGCFPLHKLHMAFFLVFGDMSFSAKYSLLANTNSLFSLTEFSGFLRNTCI